MTAASTSLEQRYAEVLAKESLRRGCPEALQLRLWCQEPLRSVADSAWAELAYARTSNPVFVFEAIALCNGREALPSWVVSYLVRAAWSLLRVASEEQNDPQRAIAEALEFKRPGRSGAANPFRSWAAVYESEWTLAQAVARLVHEGTKPYIAVQSIAGQFSVSNRTVRRASTSWRWLFDSNSLVSTVTKCAHGDLDLVLLLEEIESRAETRLSSSGQ
jgi:hypothetical protein